MEEIKQDDNYTTDLEEEVEKFLDTDIDEYLKKNKSEIIVDDALSMYIREMKQYPQLNNEESIELIKIYQETKDKDILDILLKGNFRLSLFVAKKYVNKCKNMTFLDLIQENNITFIKAIEKFDISKGIKLSTYVITAMHRILLREIDNQDRMIRKPVNMEILYNRYRKYVTKFYELNRRAPFKEEVINDLNITDERYQILIEYKNYDAESLNKVVSKEGKDSELELFVESKERGYDDIEVNLDDQIVKKAVKDLLSPKEYYVLFYRILTPSIKTLDEIALEFNLTYERIRQIENKAKEKVKRVYERIIKKTSSKYTIKELSEMNLTPIPPSLHSYFDYLKKSLDEVSYYIIFTKYFNKLDDNIDYYQKKLFGVDREEIIRRKTAIESNIDNYCNKEKINEVFQEYCSKYTISQILSLDINPNMMIPYQSIQRFFENYRISDLENYSYYQNLDSNSKNLLKKYFEIPDYFYSNSNRRNKMEIEKNINLALMGYYNNTNLTLKKSEVEEILNKYGEKFSPEIIQSIKIFWLNEPTTKEDIKKRHKHYKWIFNKLLRMKYNIYNFFANDLYLDQIEKVFNDYPGLLTEEEKKVIIGFYKENKCIKELALDNNMDYIKMHDRIRNTRRKILLRYYNLDFEEKDIKETEFVKYLLDPRYIFGEESRRILKLYFIDHLNYEQIANQNNYNRAQVSNFITEGIRKLNFYYYGILTPFVISKEELEDYIKNTKYTRVEKEMIIDRFINNLEIKEIVNKVNLKDHPIRLLLDNFYLGFLTSKVGEIKKEDYIKEVNSHINESVLTEEERYFISVRLGIKSKYNPEGKIFNRLEICDLFNITSTAIYTRIRIINTKIQERKYGIRNPEFGIISIDEIKEVLKDTNVPLSVKEKDILSSLYEIDCHELMTPQELALKYHMSEASLKRRYHRAILSIKQYQSNKKRSQISYDDDIKPILKYFSTYDANIINMMYRDKLPVLTISKKLNIPRYTAQETVDKLKINVAEILNDNKAAKKFDFEYARQVINEPDFPLPSNIKDLCIKVFEMFTGENQDHKYTSNEIAKIMNISTDNHANVNIMYEVMLATQKYKEGIRLNELIDESEIEDFYQEHKDKLNKDDVKCFERYLSRHIKFRRVSSNIVYRMLQAEGKLVFNIKNKKTEDMINLLNRGNIKIPNHTKKNIQTCYYIPGKYLMTGKEKRKVMEILYPIFRTAIINKNNTNNIKVRKL